MVDAARRFGVSPPPDPKLSV